MTEHTPGPWVADRKEDCGPDGRWEFSVHAQYVYELQQFVSETANLLEPVIARARGEQP